MKTEKLLKIARLALEGTTPGEREAAAFILAEKGLTAEELLRDAAKAEELVELTFRNATERTFIFQLYYKTFQKTEVHYERMSPKKIRLRIPAAAAGQFKEDVKTILNLWRKSFDRFVTAFIHNNDLYGPASEDGEGKGLSPEEVEEIVNYARGMKRATLGKLLEESNE